MFFTIELFEVLNYLLGSNVLADSISAVTVIVLAAVLVATVVVVVGKYRAATLEKAGNFGGLEGFSLD